MCSRFACSLPAEALCAPFGAGVPDRPVPPSWNIAPLHRALVVRRNPHGGDRRAGQDRGGPRRMEAHHWGLVPDTVRSPRTAPRPTSAPAERLPNSVTFGAALAGRRCLVPATLFYLWQSPPSGRYPYAVARADGGPLAFAGVWETWSDGGARLHSFAIVTVPANPTLAPVHDRMPAILNEADWPVWLGERPGDPLGLLRPAPADLLRLWPIGRRVNSPRQNDAALAEPVAATGHTRHPWMRRARAAPAPCDGTAVPPERG